MKIRAIFFEYFPDFLQIVYHLTADPEGLTSTSPQSATTADISWGTASYESPNAGMVPATASVGLPHRERGK